MTKISDHGWCGESNKIPGDYSVDNFSGMHCDIVVELCHEPILSTHNQRQPRFMLRIDPGK